MNDEEEKRKQVRPATMSKTAWKKKLKREAKEKRKAERAAKHEKR
jgi:hypothetical protein